MQERKKNMPKTHTTKYVGISLIRYVWDTKKNNKILLRASNALMQQWKIHIITQYEKTKYCEDAIAPKINW